MELEPERALMITPLVGWRAWWTFGNYTDHCMGIRPLSSLVTSVHTWTAAPLDRARFHEPLPSIHNSYGVHAFKSLNQAMQYFDGHFMVAAFGKVKLWGRVIEHEYGYRAEWAQIVPPLYVSQEVEIDIDVELKRLSMSWANFAGERKRDVRLIEQEIRQMEVDARCT